MEKLKVAVEKNRQLILDAERYIWKHPETGYKEKEMCCIGTFAERAAGKFNVDMAFITTLGITEEGFITDSSPEITAVKEEIMKNSGHTFFLFEKSKIGIKGLYTLCHKGEEKVTVITV